ncbi:helix-turn-helix transcriptional regulator [Muricauda oceani]|uniref:Helix-turn-helix transcriptional regulator n=1 Tax=Flagellimonas oceani TaxID=2698672 RepID=A0A6G7IZ96_9FLAO|nr:AraC family transcriptional regulator [Allomuricauda oceani]MBW8244906.1 helix-turn-helix transcriptional regulator [Allomuricauda oceani]QII43567.1 helix-turn-helix transcriptional regulator [Allomuricauda oceani]
MKKDETLEDLYAQIYDWIPDNLRKGMGHFNIFNLTDLLSKDLSPSSFNRRIYFKITLVFGKSRVHFADKSVEIKKQALLFSNPEIPYSWEPADHNQSGFSCIFTESFFEEFGTLKDYPVFRPEGNRLYNLTDAQATIFRSIFLEMFQEIDSEYVFKYDVLRNLVLQIIHKAMKLQPLQFSTQRVSNGSERITSLFMELLERQFPIESPHQHIALQSAADYANRLNIHVNHLNRSLKATTKQRTKEILAKRIIKEAKTLLRHTNWNVAQIGYCVGYEEVSNFSTFFKKHTGVSPNNFRKEEIV